MPPTTRASLHARRRRCPVQRQPMRCACRKASASPCRAVHAALERRAPRAAPYPRRLALAFVASVVLASRARAGVPHYCGPLLACHALPVPRGGVGGQAGPPRFPPLHRGCVRYSTPTARRLWTGPSCAFPSVRASPPRIGLSGPTRARRRAPRTGATSPWLKGRSWVHAVGGVPLVTPPTASSPVLASSSRHCHRAPSSRLAAPSSGRVPRVRLDDSGRR